MSETTAAAATGVEYDLPAPWSKQYSKSQQRYYYFNSANGKSVWDIKEVPGAKVKSEALSNNSAVQPKPKPKPTQQASPAIKEASAKPAAAKPTPTPKRSGGLLGSILGGIKNTSKETAKVKSNITKEVVVVDENFKKLQDYRKSVHLRLKQFSQDSSLTQMSFEPVDHDRRYIIHECVVDYNCTSVSEGEGDGRYVVAYKKGFEPEELPFMSDEQMAMYKSSAKSNKRKLDEAVPVMNADKLQKVGEVKRDRRTIEEIQRDMQMRSS